MTEALVTFYVYALGAVYLITEAAVMTFFRLVLWHFLGRIITAVYCRACVGFWVGVANALAMPGVLPGDAWYAQAVFGGFSVMLIGVLWSETFGGSYAYEAESRVFYNATDKNPDGDPPPDMRGGADED